MERTNLIKQIPSSRIFHQHIDSRYVDSLVLQFYHYGIQKFKDVLVFKCRMDAHFLLHALPLRVLLSRCFCEENHFTCRNMVFLNVNCFEDPAIQLLDRLSVSNIRLCKMTHVEKAPPPIFLMRSYPGEPFSPRPFSGMTTSSPTTLGYFGPDIN